MKLPRTRFARLAGRPGAVCAVLLALLFTVLQAAAQIPGPSEPPSEIRPDDPAAGDLFGCALAVAGETLAVGSVFDDDRGSGSGSVYVFIPSLEGWSQSAKLLASDGASGDQLGFAVDSSAGRIVAGAPTRSEVGQRSGAVYVFASSQGVWAQEAKLVPGGLGARDELGRAVAIDGSTVAAGAPGDDGQGAGSGAVYIFALGSGAAPLKLTASDAAVGDGFGFALALAGDRLLVGAPFDDHPGLPGGGRQAGSVYVFERQDSGWTQTAKLLATDAAGSSLFGSALSLSGGRAAIGARLDDRGGANAGAVYIFENQAGGWAQQAKLASPDLAAGDELGIAVSLSGDRLLAGARFASAAGASRAGVAYLFERMGSVWQPALRLSAPTPSTGDELGFAVDLATVRGLETIFAGAYRDDERGSDSGVVYVFEESRGPGDDDDDDDDDGPPPVGTADLSVDLTLASFDGESVIAGSDAVIIVNARNAGPDDVSLAETESSAPPAGLVCTWSCVSGRCGTASGAGAIADGASFPAGTAARYRLDCTLDPAATGSLSLSAAVAARDGTPDPALANNDAVLTVPVLRVADLEVIKTADRAAAVAGEPIGYSVSVSNAGPSAAAATVADVLPPELTCAWTCTASGSAACAAASGSGDILETVALPPAGAVLFELSCTVSADASGTLTNTATATAEAGVDDPTSAGSSVSVSVPIERVANLSITKSASPATVSPGDALAFTVTAANAGPSSTSASVLDELPGEALCTWTCSAAGGASCAASSGPGDLAESVALPPGSVVTYDFSCTVSAELAGDFANTAGIAPETGVTDPDLSDNSTTVVVTVVTPEADLEVTKTADRQTAALGDKIVYTVTTLNRGPDGTSALIEDTIPDGLACTWICSGFGGGACAVPSGTGSLDESAGLPAGGRVIYTLDCSVGTAAPGPLTNTAMATGTSGATDPDPTNNSAGVTITVLATADLSISKTSPQTTAVEGDPLAFSLVITNAGPQDAEGVRIVDLVPANLITVEWSCGNTSGSGDLVLSVDIPAGGSVVCSLTGTTPPGFCGRLINTAMVDLPPGVTDPDGADRSSESEILIFPAPFFSEGIPEISLCASKALTTGPHAPGSMVGYEILLFNGGPDALPDDPGDEFIDPLPAELLDPMLFANSGMIVLLPGNVLAWNGEIPAGEVVILDVTATLADVPNGTVVSNQGMFPLTQTPTDDPTTAEPQDPTDFTVAAVVEIPTLGALGLGLLVGLLLAAGWWRLRSSVTSTSHRRS